MVRMLTVSVILALLSAGANAQNADEYLIGLSHVTTGIYSSNSRFNEIAVDLAISEINEKGGVNGKKLRVIKFDTGGDPRQAQVAVNKLANDDKVLAIIGPYSSAEARVAFAAGERIGVVQIAVASSAPNITKGMKYAFRVAIGEDVQIDRLLGTLKKKGIPSKTASIIYVSDEFLQKAEGTQIIPAALKAHGIKLVGEPVGFEGSAFDIAPQIAKLKATPADLIGAGTLLDNAVKVMKEAKRQELTGRFFGGQILSDPDFRAKAGPDAEGLVYVTSFFPDFNDKTRSFTKAFNDAIAKKQENRAGPHQSDAQAYDIAYVIAEAIKNAGVTGDPAKLQEERAALRDGIGRISMEGVTGLVRFDNENNGLLPGYVIEIKNGKPSLLDRLN